MPVTHMNATDLDPDIAAADPAIEAHGLARSFGEEIDAVREIDLSVKRGEVFGFLGRGPAGDRARSGADGPRVARAPMRPAPAS